MQYINSTVGLRGVNTERDVRVVQMHLNSIMGVQQRLNNLGIASGSEDGVEGVLTKEAVRSFQSQYKSEFSLKVNGELDEDTIIAISEMYGS